MAGAQLIPLGAGVLAALLHLTVMTGSPGVFMLAYFAQLPLAATGLGLGFMPGAVASAIASIIVALAAPGSGSLTLFLMITVLPVMVVVYFALQNRTEPDGTVEWYPLGRVLGWLTALGLAAFVIALALFSGGPGGLQGAVGRYMSSLFQAFPSADQSAANAVIQTMSRFFPGAAATSWIVMTVVNCVLAQHLLVAAEKNIRPRPSYRDIEAIAWPVLVAIGGALAMFFGGTLRFIGLNALILGFVPFFFIGMAVLHSITAAWPGRLLLLAGVYIFLVLLLWPAAIVALLGIAENWLDLRGRAKRSGTNKGND